MLGKQKLEGEALEQFSGLTGLFRGEKVDFHYPLATANWQGRDGEQHTKDYGLGVVFHRAGALKSVATIMGYNRTFPPVSEQVVRQGAVVMTSREGCWLSEMDVRHYKVSNFSPDTSLGVHLDVGKPGLGLSPLDRHSKFAMGLWQQGGIQGRSAETVVVPTAYSARIIEKVRDLTFAAAVEAGLVKSGQENIWKTFQESVPNDDQYGGVVTVMAVRDITVQHLYDQLAPYRKLSEYQDLVISPEMGAIVDRVNNYVLNEAKPGSLIVDWASPSLQNGAAVVFGNGYLNNPDETKWEFAHGRNNKRRPLSGGPVYISDLELRMPI